MLSALRCSVFRRFNVRSRATLFFDFLLPPRDRRPRMRDWMAVAAFSSGSAGGSSAASAGSGASSAPASTGGSAAASSASSSAGTFFGDRVALPLIRDWMRVAAASSEEVATAGGGTSSASS